MNKQKTGLNLNILAEKFHKMEEAEQNFIHFMKCGRLTVRYIPLIAKIGVDKTIDFLAKEADDWIAALIDFPLIYIETQEQMDSLLQNVDTGTEAFRTAIAYLILMDNIRTDKEYYTRLAENSSEEEEEDKEDE